MIERFFLKSNDVYEVEEHTKLKKKRTNKVNKSNGYAMSSASQTQFIIYLKYLLRRP